MAEWFEALPYIVRAFLTGSAVFTGFIAAIILGGLCIASWHERAWRGAKDGERIALSFAVVVQAVVALTVLGAVVMA